MALLVTLFLCLATCQAAVSNLVPTNNAALLPTNVRPYHYDLSLEPFLDNSTFRGFVQIDFEVVEHAREITVHAQDLNITDARVQRYPGWEDPAISEDLESQTLTFKLSTPPRAGTNASLLINFTGYLRNDISGFFNSAFTREDGSTGVLAITHMAPTYARRAFPCFDEPALKATFTVALTAEEELTCLSNMPVDTVEEAKPAGSGRKTVRFQKTPVMSTYLATCVVGELSYIENNEAHVPIRVYTSPADDAELTRYAAHVLARGMDFYEKTFGIEYALPKLDLLAAPIFLEGAMEDWGIIISTSSLVPYDPKVDSENKKQLIAELVLHELAHQWFGNLVTFEWWDQLWLNEGGATAMTDHCIRQLEPNWSNSELSGIKGPSGAMRKDAYRSSHPIEVPASTPDEISQLFDSITYAKGAAVLQMIREHLTPEVFFAGIAKYLKAHAYGNTKTSDLWDALSKVSGQDVSSLMNPWTKSIGYPFVKVTEDGNAIHLEQHRFLLAGDVTPDEDETMWPIFLNLRTSKGVDNSTMRDRKGSAAIDLQNDDFYLLNADNTFLYRTQYSVDRLHKLSHAARQGLLSDKERAGLISDTCSLAQAGHHKISTCLDLIQSMDEEASASWTDIAEQFSYIQLAWAEDDQVSSALQSVYRQLAGKMSHKLGWDFSSGDDHDEELFKAKMFFEAGKAGDEAVLRAAKEMFRRFAEGDEGAISPSILDQVFKLVMMNGDERDYDFILKYAKTSRSRYTRRVGLSSLLVTENANLINRSLKSILSDELTPSDANFILTGTQHSKTARHMVWQWAQEHWSELRAFFPDALGLRETLPAASTRYLTTRKELEELERFVEERDVRGMESEFALSLDIVRGVVAWVERETEDLESWLGVDGPGEL